MNLPYTFRDPALLELALTHPSAVTDGAHNQRLEFLGDAALELLVSEWLYAAHPDWPEGRLSKARSAVVCRDTLAELADHFGVPDALRLGPGESRNHTRRSVNVRSDAVEALIGAVYQDGGLEAARALVLPALERWLRAADAPDNPRSTLQEWLEAQRMERPVYAEVGVEGPAHALRFRYTVSAAGRTFGPAEGGSKAGAMAAAAALAVAELVSAGPRG